MKNSRRNKHLYIAVQRGCGMVHPGPSVTASLELMDVFTFHVARPSLGQYQHGWLLSIRWMAFFQYYPEGMLNGSSPICFTHHEPTWHYQ